MLISLRLENFALIDEIQVGFEPGLCLLTGETGAGKSILVEALQILTGSRAGVECVRSGCAEASLEGLFRPGDDGAVAAWFAEAGIPFDGECVLRRTVSRTGRSAGSIGGRMVTAGQLRALGSLLVHVHGQHQGQALLDEEEHRRLLDGLPDVCDAVARTARDHALLSKAMERVRLSRRDAAERSRAMDTLRFQAGEIGRVSPKAGEDEELRTRSNRLAHAERIVSEAQAVVNILRDGETSGLGALAEAFKRARELATILPEWEQFAKEIESASSVVAGVASSAEEIASSTQFDAEALEAAQSRLADFDRLQRKYGPTFDDVIRHGERVGLELRALEDQENDPESLLRERDSRFQGFLESARDLSHRRAEASVSLAARVVTELKQLALEKSRFEVELAPRTLQEPEQAEVTGLEDVRFLFSANPGEPLKPLAKIASGGELSRAMLALLTAVRGVSGPATLVFDEVDAGIGGRPAECVGRSLRELAASRQVLCITHLPQIAVFAHHHLRVSKRRSGGRTTVGVESLDGAPRVEELARMLAGEEVTETARKHARALLEGARK
jgi:DNA repair protein RecN (Recombination protein N)